MQPLRRTLAPPEWTQESSRSRRRQARPDGGELLGCYPDTIFVVVDRPGCVSREIPGGDSALCDSMGAGMVAGQPVTVINDATKALQIQYVYLGSDGCDSHRCAIGYGQHLPNTCMCDGASTIVDHALAGPETLIIEYLDSASRRSFVLGDEHSRWRVVACTIDLPSSGG